MAFAKSQPDPTAFKYEPLRTFASGMRLLKLENECSERLAVRIEHFTLLRCPAYAALSYVWGSSEKRSKIVVNSETLHVTENLEVFLKEALRRRTSTNNVESWSCAWFWIDAICINQDDQHERSRQVAMMRQIYEHADEIVIWLGLLTEVTDSAVEAIKALSDLEGEDEVMLSDGSMPGVSCQIGNQQDSVEILYETLTFEIGEIMRSPYWERAWIIQEASTPTGTRVKRILVCFNEFSIPWKTLVKANGRLLEASYNNREPVLAPLHGVASDDVGSIDYIAGRRSQADTAEPLYTMLVRCRTALATDPKDKIYAIGQLCKERQLELLQPDYALPVSEVYLRAMKALILSSKSLDYLGSAGLPRNYGVPSWVADWTVQHQRIPQPFYQLDKVWSDDGRKVIREEKLYQADRKLALQARFDDKTLCLEGYEFDHICKVSWPRSTFPTDQSENAQWQSWIETAQVDRTSYVGGGTKFEAFSKLLRTDIDQIWGDWSAERGSTIDGFEDISENVFAKGDAIVDAMTSVRRLIVTQKTYIGLAPEYAEINDRICIIPGCQMPLVLRPVGARWLFVGQAYVHGIMDGEGIVDLDASHSLQVFEIE